MKFFVILNNQQEGPYTIAQLAEMGISSETLVWKEGMKDWQPAWTISELRYILNEKTMNIGMLLPQASNKKLQFRQHPLRLPIKRKETANHYLLKIFGGLVLLLLIIMALTNPNKESHENAIRTEVSKAVEKQQHLMAMISSHKVWNDGENACR